MAGSATRQVVVELRWKFHNERQLNRFRAYVRYTVLLQWLQTAQSTSLDRAVTQPTEGASRAKKSPSLAEWLSRVYAKRTVWSGQLKNVTTSAS